MTFMVLWRESELPRPQQSHTKLKHSLDPHYLVNRVSGFLRNYPTVPSLIFNSYKISCKPTATDALTLMISCIIAARWDGGQEGDLIYFMVSSFASHPH